MSINEMDSKIKELRELRRMADELTAEIESIQDAIKAHMYALEPLSRSHGLPGVLSGTKSDQKKEIIEIRKAQRKLTKEVVMAQRRKMREQEAKLDAHSRGEIVRNTGNVEEK